MTTNPYESPKTDPGTLQNSGNELRDVARLQKAIIICLLLGVIVGIAQLATPPNFQFLSLALWILVSLAGTIVVFLLSAKLFGTPLGILFGLLTFVPLIGLFILAGVNGKATHILRENGIKVGFFGANMNQL